MLSELTKVARHTATFFIVVSTGSPITRVKDKFLKEALGGNCKHLRGAELQAGGTREASGPSSKC